MERDPTPAWFGSAACRGRAHTMYPRPTDSVGIARAKRICADCPVQAQCAAHAIASGEKYGVWGGLTPNERQAAPRGTPRNEPIDL